MRRKIVTALQHHKCFSLPDSRVARLSISIQYYNTFREDYHNKFHIKIFGIYPTIDL